jgi:hypothetical protein
MAGIKVKVQLNHRVLTPIPLSSTRGKAGRNHLKEEITPSSPLG